MKSNFHESMVTAHDLLTIIDLYLAPGITFQITCMHACHLSLSLSPKHIFRGGAGGRGLHNYIPNYTNVMNYYIKLFFS